MHRTTLAALAAGVVLLLHGPQLLAQAAPPAGMPAAPLGVPETRLGSGTSWIPDASTVHALMTRAGSWSLMGQGDIVLYGDAAGTGRGGSQIGSTNWLMLMAMRQAGSGLLRLDAMVSAEPATVGQGGYPLILQTGESYRGQALHDRQHPHDLWMELSAAYERPLTRGLALSLYAAPVGEPALGPVAFMHRPSAADDPFANIAHHWQDATHITYGVATVGLFTRAVKLEGSVFNGREPDEDRADFDFRPLDSWSVRLSAAPAPRWSFNASYGFLRSPEGLHPDESLDRFGASAMYVRPFGASGQWASALIYGANRQSIAGQSAHPVSNSVLLESDLRFDARNAVFGRVTWVQKDTAELSVSGVPDIRYGVTTLSLGYVRQAARLRAVGMDVGLRGDLGYVPAALQPVYGTRTPAGLMLFVRLRPASSDRGAGHGMRGMKMGMAGH